MHTATSNTRTPTSAFLFLRANFLRLYNIVRLAARAPQYQNLTSTSLRSQTDHAPSIFHFQLTFSQAPYSPLYPLTAMFDFTTITQLIVGRAAAERSEYKRLDRKYKGAEANLKLVKEVTRSSPAASMIGRSSPYLISIMAFRLQPSQGPPMPPVFGPPSLRS